MVNQRSPPPYLAPPLFNPSQTRSFWKKWGLAFIILFLSLYGWIRSIFRPFEIMGAWEPHSENRPSLGLVAAGGGGIQLRPGQHNLLIFLRIAKIEIKTTNLKTVSTSPNRRSSSTIKPDHPLSCTLFHASTALWLRCAPRSPISDWHPLYRAGLSYVLTVFTVGLTEICNLSGVKKIWRRAYPWGFPGSRGRPLLPGEALSGALFSRMW